MASSGRQRLDLEPDDVAIGLAELDPVLA